MNRARYAQQGDEGACAACGRKVEFRVVGYDLFGVEVFRWVAVRRTKNAPIPINCPDRARSAYHDTEGHRYDGTPRAARADAGSDR